MKHLLLSVLFTFILTSAAHANPAYEVIHSTIKERSKYTGTVDLYDEKIDRVRNLKLLKPMVEDIKVDFRDQTSGEIVTLEFIMDEEGFTVEEIVIGEISKASKEAAAPMEKKEYTDAEVQAAMQAYFDLQSKYTSGYMLFDPKQEKLLKLNIVKIREGVRRYGKRFISTVDAEEVEDGKKYVLDITMEDKGGRLDAKSVKIK